MTRRRRRVVVLLLILFVALPVVGSLYEMVAEVRDANVAPPPGTRVDIGGRRLHLLCIGSGSPTVLFESPAFGTAASVETARSELAKDTRVCSYDRAGSGWSDRAPSTLSVGTLADDLRQLQDRASLSPPFVLVAASMGGLTAEMFARRYPDRVAGAVFLDAGNSALLPQYLDTFDSFKTRVACATASVATVTGAVRLIDPWNLRADTDPRPAAVLYRAQPWRTICAMARAARISAAEFAQAPKLRADLPLRVLLAERSTGLVPARLEQWAASLADLIVATHRDDQKQLAAQSTRGSWQIVPGSEHLIAVTQPAAVIDTVRQMVREIRN